jgi:hypothetical protein
MHRTQCVLSASGGVSVAWQHGHTHPTLRQGNEPSTATTVLLALAIPQPCWQTEGLG